MKAKLILILVLIILLTFSCSKRDRAEEQRTGWKGTIEYEEGVKVVKNPVEPAHGEITFQLEENLSLGREDDENYSFYGIRDIGVDRDGNIFVLEYRNCRLQKFDRDGNYLQTIGRQGQGPGEFQRPLSLLLSDKTGNIYVSDAFRIDIFNKEGNYLKSAHFRKIPYDFLIDSDGNIWMKFFKTEEAGAFMAFGKVNTQGEIITDIVSFPYTLTAIERGALLIAENHGYEHDLYISGINDQNIIYAYSKDYELNVINKEGKLLFKIKKDEPYHPFTEKEKDKIRGGYKNYSSSERKAFPIPDIRPFFNSVFTDDEGRIYVQRVRSPLDEQEGLEFDIFSKDGYYLYKAILPYEPYVLKPGIIIMIYVIKNGSFYTLEENEETGFIFVKRFKIKNWDQIKKGI